MYENEQYPFNPFAQNLAIVKNYFKRPAVLVQAIMVVVAIVASLVLSILSVISFSDVFASIFSDPELYADMPSELLPYMNELQNSQSSLTINLSSIVLPALLAAAFFIIYFKSKNDNPMSNPMPGFTMMYVVAIINLVFACISALVLLLFMLIFVIMLIAFSSDPTMASDMPFFTGLFVGIMVMFALLIALMLTYSISHVKYVKSVRDSLSSVTLSSKGAGVYGTCNVIYAVVSGIGVLLMLGLSALFAIMGEVAPELSAFESLAPLYLVSAAVSVIQFVVYIIEAVISKGYKKYIDEITGGYNDIGVPQPMYAPSVYVPQMTADNAFSQQVCCPNCGAVAGDDDVFCNACGLKIR